MTVQLRGIKMKKESSTTRKVVSLSEEKFSRMTEDELLAHVIDQLVTQVNQLAVLTADFSTRLSSVEDALASSSTPALFDATE